VKIRPKSGIASPGELAMILRVIADDMDAVGPMYERLHSMGLESGRSETVAVSGGDASDPTGTIAAESELARRRRAYARWVVKEVIQAGIAVDRVRQGLERNVGPGPGYRQPQSIGTNAVVTIIEYSESLRKQSERLARGEE
jgi:hypothetical protein